MYKRWKRTDYVAPSIYYHLVYFYYAWVMGHETSHVQRMMTGPWPRRCRNFQSLQSYDDLKLHHYAHKF